MTFDIAEGRLLSLMLADKGAGSCSLSDDLTLA
jgi:hypothetical protein